jgi:HPr Serine kinase C-terminal domain
LDGRETIHASTVAIEGRGVMILGASGAGKSDLALRLIDRGAMLVADDYTELSSDGGTLVASAPATIAGRIEVRGLGIVPTPHVDHVPVALAVQLGADAPRMPEPSSVTLAGVAVRCFALDPRPASAPLVIELALRHALP